MTSKPHDALFKSAFDHPAHAAVLLRAALPPNLSAAIQWHTLRREPGSFIEDDLADRHSDLLFAAQIDGGTALLYLLLEHQSTNHPAMPLRMLVYMARILERARRTHPNAPLPVILPIVISHAPEGWTAPRSLHAMFEPDPRSVPGLAELVPGFSVVIEDLAALTNDQIRDRAFEAFQQLTIWLLRDGRTQARLLANLDAWLLTLNRVAYDPSGVGAVAQILRYIALVTDDLHLDVFRAKIRERAPEVERVAMTIAEQMRLEGEAKGRAEGEAKGRAAMLSKLITLKFGAVAPGVFARIESGRSEELDRWVERVLTAEHVDDVFAD